MAAVNSAGRLGLSFEIQGVPQMNRVLGAKISAIKDLRPIWKDVCRLLRKNEFDVFLKQGAVGEAAPESGVETWGEWKELNKKYAARKAADGFGSKILIREGDLFRSLVLEKTKGSVFGPHPLWMEYGTTIPYAAVHQRPRPTNKLPKREPLRITKETVRGVVRLISKYLSDSGQKERSNI